MGEVDDRLAIRGGGENYVMSSRAVRVVQWHEGDPVPLGCREMFGLNNQPAAPDLHGGQRKLEDGDWVVTAALPGLAENITWSIPQDVFTLDTVDSFQDLPVT